MGIKIETKNIIFILIVILALLFGGFVFGLIALVILFVLPKVSHYFKEEGEDNEKNSQYS